MGTGQVHEPEDQALELLLARLVDRDDTGAEPALLEALERSLEDAESPISAIAWLAVNALRVEGLLAAANSLEESRLVREYRSAEEQKQRGLSQLTTALRDRRAATRETLRRGHALLRAAGLWSACADLALFEAVHADDPREFTTRLDDARAALERAYGGPPSRLLELLEGIRHDTVARVRLWIAFLERDETTLASLEIDAHVELIVELAEVLGIGREIYGEDHPLWSGFLDRLAPTQAWFDRVFLTGAATALALIYREAFRPQLSQVVNDLRRRDGWRASVVRPASPAIDTTGHQRALFAVMRVDEPLYTLKSGGYSLPNFIIEDGTLRWLGKMNLSMIHTVNQEVFERAAKGSLEGFVQGSLRGEAAVRAMLEHLARDAG